MVVPFEKASASRLRDDYLTNRRLLVKIVLVERTAMRPDRSVSATHRTWHSVD